VTVKELPIKGRTNEAVKKVVGKVVADYFKCTETLRKRRA